MRLAPALNRTDFIPQTDPPVPDVIDARREPTPALLAFMLMITFVPLRDEPIMFRRGVVNRP